MLLLSTDSPQDLALHNSELVSFTRDLPPLAEVDLLRHPHKWFVGTRHGCSCGFRHLYIGSVSLGFAEPQDWYVEEQEDIEATLELLNTLKLLVTSGASVDCIDAWGHESESAELDGTVEINLTEMRDRAFRLFENHRFTFRSGA
jgi:hypothetical protein